MARLAASRMSYAATRASNALERTSGEVEQAVVASQLKAGPHCVRGARCGVRSTVHRRGGAAIRDRVSLRIYRCDQPTPMVYHFSYSNSHPKGEHCSA